MKINQFNNSYFLLYQCCFMAKGAARSSLVDTQRGKIRLIPNDLYDILEQCKYRKIGEIIPQYDKSEVKTIERYFEVLIQEEMGEFTENITAFVPISQELVSPNIVNNSIIDIRKEIRIDFNKVLKQLETLGCKGLQIRIFENINMDDFFKMFIALDSIQIQFVEILLNSDEIYSYKIIKDILLKFDSVNRIILFNSSVEKFYEYNSYQSIIKIKSALNNIHNCGVISPDYFSFALEHLIESMQFNSCLNKKLSIDENGLIKNCPSCNENMGNAEQQHSLITATKSKQFSFYNGFKKDDILVCKDCEFRYICTDCRQYLSNSEDILSKPAKCRYNPYLAIWEG